MARRRKKDIIKPIGIAVLLIAGIISYLCANPDLLQGFKTVSPDAECYVDFIDCGQGDSTLIVSKGSAALIDASTGEDGERVVAHLKKRGIERIDHFVLTHPHEDHIGGAKAVLDAVEVENIYMRTPTKGTEPTTSVYLNLLKKIKALGKTIHAVRVNDTFECGSVTFTAIGPLEDYEDLNDQSIILQAEIGKISFLLTGDQEAPAERDIVDRYENALNSTVLKVGHHGSNGSSCIAFLQAVSPEYAVISCGVDNSYGHPHDETLDRLEEHEVTYYRTDTQGTVTAETDGKTIAFTEEK